MFLWQMLKAKKELSLTSAAKPAAARVEKRQNGRLTKVPCFGSFYVLLDWEHAKDHWKSGKLWKEGYSYLVEFV